MSSRAIKPKRDSGGQASPWKPIEERAPSVVRQEGPTFARILAVISLMLVVLGAASLLFRALDKPYLIPSGWGFFILSVGVAGLLYHAFNEKDFQLRRLYGALGFLLAVAAACLRVIPVGNDIGGAFLPYGALCMFLSLGFLLTFVKNEGEPSLRSLALAVIGLAGLVNALIGLIAGMISPSFLLTAGVIHLVAGLLFLAGYVGMQGIATPRGFLAGRAIGVLGLAMFLLALGRSLWPWLHGLLQLGGEGPPAFFLPAGLVFMYVGVEYLAAYLGICSDNKLVVLTRRELGAFFYSPIAYILILGMAAVGWLNFWIFFASIDRGGQAVEPIVERFLISFLALIPMIFVVPAITMRMLSEEKRSGTLEVLLTAPVNEWQVVLSKFLAGLRIFMLCFYVWGVFFIALRIEGDRPFDYRPIITFALALVCMGSGFVAMGLFFSSVTTHQVMAAILTFAMMMLLTLLYILGQFVPETGWISTLISCISYVDLWIESSRGRIVPRLLVLNITVAAFWLYLATKVLEARKWS